MALNTCHQCILILTFLFIQVVGISRHRSNTHYDYFLFTLMRFPAFWLIEIFHSFTDGTKTSDGALLAVTSEIRQFADNLAHTRNNSTEKIIISGLFSMLSLATKFGITLMRHKKLRCRCHKDTGISNRQYFCGVRRTDISANNRYTDGY